jgi:hypothetical protein
MEKAKNMYVNKKGIQLKKKDVFIMFNKKTKINLINNGLE